MDTIKCSLYLPTGSTIITVLNADWQILPNFKLRELANNLATDEQTIDGVRFAIDSQWGWLYLRMLQNARNENGEMNLTSGYRTQAFNDSLKDATPNSQHCHMQAVDNLLGSMTYDKWIASWKRNCELFNQIGAIGLYRKPDRVHLEIGSDRRYGATKFQVRDYR